MRVLTFALFIVLVGSNAVAQVDLGLPKEPRKVVMHGSGAALYAPDGPGPHAAVVLSHTCATLGRHVSEWASRLREAGYVALVLDHLEPRKLKFNCPPHANKVSVTTFAQDAVAGMKHLRTLPFVDGQRIAHMGFSYGAMAGLRVASSSFRRKHLGSERFAAVIAFYPWCNERTPLGGDHQYNFYDDADLPLLLLLGADDDEARPATCIQQAKKNARKGLPVSWKVYPNTTHGFDLSHLGGKPLKRQMGNRMVTYRYNPKSVEEAWHDTREFLARHLGSKR